MSQFKQDQGFSIGDNHTASQQSQFLNFYEQRPLIIEKLKIVRDPIYSQIQLEELAVKIIDTPQFQRLRRLKQNANAYMVYPSSTQTRFEHSLGVYHLTNQLLQHLKQYKPASLSDHDYDKCAKIVRLAGLLHDIGHGPFSHHFEEVLKEQKIHIANMPVISHEVIGKQIILDLLFNIQNSGLTQEDIDSVCELVHCENVSNFPILFQKYRFFTQIVSNDYFSLDTDKLDYLKRDSFALNLQITLQPERIITMTRICKYPEINGHYYLCFDYRAGLDLSNVFNNRYYLHKILYQHPKIVGFDLLTSKILSRMNQLMLTDFERDLNFLFSEQADKFNGYLYLDDNIIFQTMSSYRHNFLSKQKYQQDAELEKLFVRYSSHKFYPLTLQFSVPIKTRSPDQQWDPRQLQAKLSQIDEELVLVSRKINYGNDYSSPLEAIPLYYQIGNQHQVFVQEGFKKQVELIEKKGKPVQAVKLTDSIVTSSQFPQRLQPGSLQNDSITSGIPSVTKPFTFHQQMLAPQYFKEIVCFVYYTGENTDKIEEFKQLVADETLRFLEEKHPLAASYMLRQVDGQHQLVTGGEVMRMVTNESPSLRPVEVFGMRNYEE